MQAFALTVGEVAELLRVSRHTVYRLAQRGDLPGRKIGRIWRFSRRGVEQLLSGEQQDVEVVCPEPERAEEEGVLLDGERVSATPGHLGGSDHV